MAPHLVQVCNVGEICGGTGACAWTITRALPGFRHTVLSLSPWTAESQKEFGECELQHIPRVTNGLLHRLSADLVILHNTAPSRVDELHHCPSLLYAHSLGARADATWRVACSGWLSAQQRLGLPVLYQPVPVSEWKKPAPCRQFDEELIIGRMCTPILKKWPLEIIKDYRQWANEHPRVFWEFVGAPEALRPQLSAACQERVRFWPAEWSARQHLHRWHALLYHHPTLTESFGRTCAEAMRSGCVPIVDARGGFLEQVESGESGFLCRATAEFSAAIKALCDPALRWTISRKAKAAADSRCSYAAFRQQLDEILRSAPGRK
ncbi:glycosyltransferase family 4 protein [Planctomicrobium sp. SH664]|uniref:glycosyltransferase family 4 protein n=1 Tax=Planctomicrobium sp. SH664 TaxID=3448125 RepID=UPI003F5BA78C